MNIPTMIALGSIGVFFTGVTGLILYRLWLAKITIKHHDKLYQYGDVVEGVVTMEAKKDLKLDSLEISLNCTKFISSNSSNSSQSRTETLFQDVWASEGPVTIMGRGDRKNFSFSFTIPEGHPKKPKSNALSIDIPMIDDEYFKELAENVSEYQKSHYNWSINVEAKNKNFRFSKGQRVSVEGYEAEDRKESMDEMHEFYKTRGRYGMIKPMFKILKSLKDKQKKF